MPVIELSAEECDRELKRIEATVSEWVAGTPFPMDVAVRFAGLARAGKGEFIVRLVGQILEQELEMPVNTALFAHIQSASDALSQAGDELNSVSLLLRLQPHKNQDAELLRTIIAKLDTLGLGDLANNMNELLADLKPEAVAYLRRARQHWKNQDATLAYLDVQRSLSIDPTDQDALALYREMVPERIQREWQRAPARKVKAIKTEPSHRRLQIIGFHNSGVSWLTTTLFQLGYYVNRCCWGRWADLDSGTVFLPPDHSIVREQRKFPGLNQYIASGSFDGKRHISIKGSHCWPSAQYAGLDTVLVYRNLMSVLWSLYKRRVVTATTGDKNLREYFDQTIDESTGLGYPDKWGLYHLMWINLYAGENLLLLSFDEGRREPVREIGQVLDLIGDKHRDVEILKASGNAYQGENSHGDEELTLMQVGRGSTDDYLNVFSHQDEKWISGLPRKMWDYFEGKWDGNVVDMSFVELIPGLENYEGTLAPNLAELCENGSFDVAYRRANALSYGRDCNAVFVFAMNRALKLIDNPMAEEMDAILDEQFVRALKVFIYAFQNLMAPGILQAAVNMEFKRA